MCCCSLDTVHLQCAAMREDARLALHDLAIEAGGLRMAMVQHVTDLQTELEQSMESVRSPALPCMAHMASIAATQCCSTRDLCSLSTPWCARHD